MASLYKVGMSVKDFSEAASYYHTMYENKVKLSDNDIADMKSHLAIMEESIFCYTYAELQHNLTRVINETDNEKIKSNLNNFIKNYLDGHQVDVNVTFVAPKKTTTAVDDENKVRIKEKPDITLDSLKADLSNKKKVEKDINIKSKNRDDLER